MPTLGRVLRGGERERRWWAITALERIGKVDQRVLPTLMEVAVLPYRDGQHQAKAFAEANRFSDTAARIANLLMAEPQPAGRP